tara:strand:- start:9063 stop:10775 length:1713 start_codon:yes stop_codon:yes gene_type:complete
MKSLKKIFYIIGNKNKTGLYILVFFNILIFFLEFFSLISIPIFVAALLENKIPDNKFSSYLSFLSQENFLLFSTVFVVLTFTLKNLLVIYNAYFQAKYLKNIRASLSIKFFNYYFNSSALNNFQIIPSVMARNVTTVVQGFYGYCEHLNKLAREFAASITIAAILFILNVKVTVILVSTFFVISFFYLRYLRPKIKKKAKENQSLVAIFNKVIFETFEAIRDIKVYQKEKIVSELFKKKINTFESNFFFFSVFDKFPRIILELVSIVSILIVSIVVLNYTDNVFQTLPLLALVVVSTIRLIPAFSGISTAFFYLRVYKPNIDTIYDQLIEISSNTDTNNKKNQQSIKNYREDLDINKNYLVVDQISFSYEKDKALLNDITLKIPKGSFVSIMGPSGSGKTTLQNIMMGLIEPDKGSIFFENQNIFSIYNQWMSKISYVSQKVFLFDDTVEKNICLNFDDSKIDQERLERAIEVSELKEKIHLLNNKMDENVGTDGLKLSGGERQRIALARAIYKNSEILFLDEFTSNLDILTEEKIINKLRKNFPHITIVMITHRPEMAKKGDILFKLDN